ncbi:MAG: hypothetical protein C4522_08135 [Desulfobacteraceae bacterium]|nr:MAG: hypothetical protein C4522_08135 [Desulfobacteraceae bacterium]
MIVTVATLFDFEPSSTLSVYQFHLAQPGSAMGKVSETFITLFVMIFHFFTISFGSFGMDFDVIEY